MTLTEENTMAKGAGTVIGNKIEYANIQDGVLAIDQENLRTSGLENNSEHPWTAYIIATKDAQGKGVNVLDAMLANFEAAASNAGSSYKFLWLPSEPAVILDRDFDETNGEKVPLWDGNTRLVSLLYWVNKQQVKGVPDEEIFSQISPIPYVIERAGQISEEELALKRKLRQFSMGTSSNRIPLDKQCEFFMSLLESIVDVHNAELPEGDSDRITEQQLHSGSLPSAMINKVAQQLGLSAQRLALFKEYVFVVPDDLKEQVAKGTMSVSTAVAANKAGITAEEVEQSVALGGRFTQEDVQQSKSAKSSAKKLEEVYNEFPEVKQYVDQGYLDKLEVPKLVSKAKSAKGYSDRDLGIPVKELVPQVFSSAFDKAVERPSSDGVLKITSKHITDVLADLKQPNKDEQDEIIDRVASALRAFPDWDMLSYESMLKIVNLTKSGLTYRTGEQKFPDLSVYLYDSKPQILAEEFPEEFPEEFEEDEEWDEEDDEDEVDL